jgi:hypothetical protein
MESSTFLISVYSILPKLFQGINHPCIENLSILDFFQPPNGAKAAPLGMGKYY